MSACEEFGKRRDLLPEQRELSGDLKGGLDLGAEPDGEEHVALVGVKRLAGLLSCRRECLQQVEVISQLTRGRRNRAVAFCHVFEHDGTGRTRPPVHPACPATHVSGIRKAQEEAL